MKDRSAQLIAAASLGICTLCVWGQQADRMIPVLGILSVSAGPHDSVYEEIRRGLRDLGYAAC